MPTPLMMRSNETVVFMCAMVVGLLRDELSFKPGVQLSVRSTTPTPTESATKELNRPTPHRCDAAKHLSPYYYKLRVPAIEP
jgi:hypothetical protein